MATFLSSGMVRGYQAGVSLAVRPPGIPDAQHFDKGVCRLPGASPSVIRARSATATVDPDR